jgi:hypothetical protein
LTYKDSHQREMRPSVSILDWAMYGQTAINVYGAHESAVALRTISKAVKDWGEGPGGGLKVFSRDGDAKDARQIQAYHQRRAEREAERQAASE